MYLSERPPLTKIRACSTGRFERTSALKGVEKKSSFFLAKVLGNLDHVCFTSLQKSFPEVLIPLFSDVPFVPRNADGSVPEQRDLFGVIGTFSKRGITATKLITPKLSPALYRPALAKMIASRPEQRARLRALSFCRLTEARLPGTCP
jgi:hypothetical protein